MHVDEICHAIAIRIGSNYLDNYDIPKISTLLECCQGLVTVDKGASTLRLIHFTLQEHHCTHVELSDRTHSTMVEIRLTYLNFHHIKDLPASQRPDPANILEHLTLTLIVLVYYGTKHFLELPMRADFKCPAP